MAPGLGRGGIEPGLGRGPAWPGAGRGPPCPGAGRLPPDGVAGRGPPCPGAGRPPPGRGAPGAGRGAGRSTGAEEYGLLPTRGALGPGLGPGPAGFGAAGAEAASLVAADAAGACSTGAAGAAGSGVGAAGAGAGAAAGVAGAAGAASTGACAAGASGSAGRGAGLGPGRGPPGFAAPGFAVLLAARSAAARPFGAAAAGADASVFSDGKDSRSRRATGASTVDDADLTNSPCSLSRASSSLLVTPSSFANSCTRALPATALLTERPSEALVPARPRVNSDGRSSSVLHGVLISAVACSSRRVELCALRRRRLRKCRSLQVFVVLCRRLGAAPRCGDNSDRGATMRLDREVDARHPGR